MRVLVLSVALVVAVASAGLLRDPATSKGIKTCQVCSTRAAVCDAFKASKDASGVCEKFDSDCKSCCALLLAGMVKEAKVCGPAGVVVGPADKAKAKGEKAAPEDGDESDDAVGRAKEKALKKAEKALDADVKAASKAGAIKAKVDAKVAKKSQEQQEDADRPADPEAGKAKAKAKAAKDKKDGGKVAADLKKAEDAAAAPSKAKAAAPKPASEQEAGDGDDPTKKPGCDPANKVDVPYTDDQKSTIAKAYIDATNSCDEVRPAVARATCGRIDAMHDAMEANAPSRAVPLPCTKIANATGAAATCCHQLTVLYRRSHE
eukprot:g5695.t1